MHKDVARMYSVVNEILGFVRGAGQEMEIGAHPLSAYVVLKSKGGHA